MSLKKHSERIGAEQFVKLLNFPQNMDIATIRQMDLGPKFSWPFILFFSIN